MPASFLVIYMTPEQATRHESGLEFLRPSEHFSNLGRRSGSRCFGQLLNYPQFTTLEQMRDMATRLDSVTLRRIYYSDTPMDREDGRIPGLREDKRRFATVSNSSDRVYAYVSKDYTPVNDLDAFSPLMDVAQENGLKLIGRFDGVGTGLTRGHVIFANPEFRVRLLEDYDDDIMLGVRMTNSYDLSASVRMDVFGVRRVCINYNLWGRALGYIWEPHMFGAHENLQDKVREFLNSIVKKSSILSVQAQRALETEVLTMEIPDLLWAIDLPIGGIDGLSANPMAYNPDIEGMGLNMWTLDNGVTAYLTWGRPKGAQYYETSMEYALAATQLLSSEHDALLEKGREACERYRERMKNRDGEKQTVRVVKYDSG